MSTQDAPTPIPAIEAVGVEKVYGATIALAGANLRTMPGEIHGLLGENGAGKSTLVRILAGIETPDAGEVRLFGGPVTQGDPSCAFIHQDLALFPTLSVAANIALVGGYRRRLGLIDDRTTTKKVRELLDRLGMNVDPTMLVGELPLADQTAVAVARALSNGVRLIVLDEPTAYLEARQVRSLLQLLGKLRSEGVACLLITHRAADVLTACDSLTVLRDGRTVASQSSAGMSESQLVELISGHAVEQSRGSQAAVAAPKEVLRLTDAKSAGFGPLSLTVGAGEIVGVCGLADAGTFEVGRAVFGLRTMTAGQMTLDGRTGQPRAAADAIARGIAYVPVERRAEGLAEGLSARENIFMKPLGSPFAPVRAQKERVAARSLMERMGVYPVYPDHVMTTFSGGNQQKIVMAKWLQKSPRLLVLNEPTAGVDLGAKADIHARVRTMSQEMGFGVLLISTDFSEVADVADRIYVMRHGRIVDEVHGGDANRLVALAYGGVEV